MDVPMHQTDGFTIYALSEYAITVAFDDKIDPDILRHISKLNTLLQRRPFDGFRTTVPAYSTLSIFFDPIKVMQSPHLDGINCFERLSNYLAKVKDDAIATEIPETAAISIPVCYGGAFGPDLDEVARLHGIAAQEVIDMHCAATYQVYLIGFTPGFAYLGGMSEALATARKSTPRNAVPTGSVGIAGKQTGIYGLETPGGWQLIGRTPMELFNPNRTPPTWLKAGDRVVFKPIEHHQFTSYCIT